MWELGRVYGVISGCRCGCDKGGVWRGAENENERGLCPATSPWPVPLPGRQRVCAANESDRHQLLSPAPPHCCLVHSTRHHRLFAFSWAWPYHNHQHLSSLTARVRHTDFFLLLLVSITGGPLTFLGHTEVVRWSSLNGLLHISFVISISPSPSYSRHCWLGVKNQFLPSFYFSVGLTPIDTSEHQSILLGWFLFWLENEIGLKAQRPD